MKTFEIGKKYYARSLCDHNCIFTVEVLARTAQTIKARVDGRDFKTLRIAVRGGAERVRPHGSYSMACTIDATDDVPLYPDWHKPVLDAESEAEIKRASAYAEHVAYFVDQMVSR
jgi:hypothetical protein